MDKRIECRECHRKFDKTALIKHEKICKKVFGSKRRIFQIKRVDDTAIKAQKNNQSKDIKKIISSTKWRRKSVDLRYKIKKDQQEQYLSSKMNKMQIH